MFRPYHTMTKADAVNELRQENAQEKQKEDREKVRGGAQRGLERAIHRPNTREDKNIADSMAKQATGEPAKSSLRKKMPLPGRLQWGGQITTERDALYCRCGHPFAKHCDTLPGRDGCACSFTYKQESR